MLSLRLYLFPCEIKSIDGYNRPIFISQILLRLISFFIIYTHFSGAVSCLFAAALKTRGYDIEHVTVFGTPKFTDKKGAHQLAEMLPIERVEHVNDPVSISPMVRITIIMIL